VINKLTSQHPHVLSMPDTAPNEEKSDSLVVPDQLRPLDEDDYPEVLYWHEESWVKHTEEKRERGQNPSRLGFLTNDDGNPVTESRITAFMSAAKQAWNELYRLRLDPSSWTKKTPKAASYFTYILKRNFDEFRYCDGDWKVERFAIVKYPDWCRDARESGRLTRASKVPSICFLLTMFVLGARPSKRKTGDCRSLKDERKQKKAKAKLTVPSGAQVIDLANDVPASSSTSRSTTNSTSAPVTTTLNPPSPLTIPASSPHQESSTSTALSVSAIYVSRSPSLPSQVATPAIPAQLPARSNVVSSAAVVLSSNLSASDPGASTLMQGKQTDARHTGSEKSRSSSGDPSSSAAPAMDPGVLTALKSVLALILMT
jgi:hypothetical protein